MKRTTLILAVLFVLGLTSNTLAQSKTREQMIDEIAARRKELDILEHQFLAVSETDRNEFAQLLGQPNTGLIRLLPREKFDSESYKNERKTITMRGGGAYYSFVRLTHEYGYGSDIELNQGQIHVGFAGFDYGMIVRIPDLSLEGISAESPAAKTLMIYQPVKLEPDIRREQRRFSDGTVIDGINLKETVPVEVNAIYLLRSISYEQSDVLVGLQVVRKDSDGSVVIAWKLLNKFPTPKAIRNKEEVIGSLRKPGTAPLISGSL
jgi:hypothetical protein